MIKLGKKPLDFENQSGTLGDHNVGEVDGGIRVAQKEVWAHFISPLEVSPKKSKKKLVVEL